MFDLAKFKVAEILLNFMFLFDWPKVDKISFDQNLGGRKLF